RRPTQTQLYDGSHGLRRRPVSVRDFGPSARVGSFVGRIFGLGLRERAAHITCRDGPVPIDGFTIGALPEDSDDRAAARFRDTFQLAQRGEAIMPASGDRKRFHPITIEPFALICDDEKSPLAILAAFWPVIELRANLVARRGPSPSVRSGVRPIRYR